MKKMVFVVVAGLLLLCLGAGAAAAGEITVVASTTWVGAIAEAAGITDVTVLAPVELRHPAEYDFSPRDIQTALAADYVVWAGYEGFIPNLAAAGNIPPERILQVYTNNSPPVLEESVRSLAEMFGTMEQFFDWQQKLQALAGELQAAAAEAEVSQITAAVQAHQEVWLRWLGYDVVAVFGPGEITPGKLGEVLQLQPDIIVDNWHSAQGEPFVQGGPYYSLLNFPGPENTETLLDILRHNGRVLGLLTD